MATPDRARLGRPGRHGADGLRPLRRAGLLDRHGLGRRATSPRPACRHLLEHMLFRGTARYRVAGDRPALRRHGRRAQRRHRQGDDVGLLARARPPPRARLGRHRRHGLAARASTPPTLEQEREIVLEEIAMYEDDPQDKVFDVLGEAVFGAHPLGRAIIGRADVVGAARPRRGWRAFHAARYVPANVVVAAAGLGRPRRARRARRSARASSAPARRRAGAGPAPPERRQSPRAGASSPRRPSSTTSASARPGIARDDERRFALRVLDDDPRRHVVLAALPGGAREARAGLQRLLVPGRYTRARARSGCTSARAPTTSRRRCASSADELDALPRGAGHRRRARSAPRRTSRAASCSRSSRPRRA